MIVRLTLVITLLAGLSAAFAVPTPKSFRARPLSSSTFSTPPPPPTTSSSSSLPTKALGLSAGAVQAAPPPPELKPPPALYEGAVAAGAAKAKAPFAKIFKLGMVAGCHIGIGIYLAASVGGACPGIAESNPGLQKLILGAIGLPTGLIMTLVTGAELFTGNTALVTAAYMEEKIKAGDLVKNWTASYLGNLAGSILLAFLAFQSGTLGTAPGAVKMAMAKVSLPFVQAFTRGILCNWLVCMAVYMASGCSSMAGKMTAVWFPIMAFVALGLEHSVANMCLIPLAMFRGAEITIGQMFLNNIIPVTLGNIVGGALCVMAPFGTTVGKWFQKKDD